MLVTDTAGDVRDARETGIRVVGVAWGMHSVDELLDAGAEFVALWPQEITAYLLGDAAAEPPGGACAVGARPADEDEGCGCGCSGAAASGAVDPVGLAAAVRRTRRTAARAHVLRTVSGEGAGRPAPTGTATPPAPRDGVTVPAELLAAVRTVCGDG